MKYLPFSYIILLAVILACCSSSDAFKEEEPPPPGNSTDQEPDLTIMTYNIHHGNPPAQPDVIDLETIARVINEADPDLVALQEVDVFTERSGKSLHQAERLGKLTGMHVFFTRAMYYDGGEYGNAILSKLPLLESERYLLPTRDDFAGVKRVLATVKVASPDGREVIFASAHLDHRYEENRLFQAEKIMEVIEDESLSVILAGDINDFPDSSTLAWLRGHFSVACLNFFCSDTFPARDPNSTLDYIMSSPRDSFEVISHDVIPEPHASDHLPVLAKFKFQ